MSGELILPCQSGQLGKGALGYMQLGVGPTPIGNLSLPYDLGSKVWVEIYTPEFVMAGIVGDYESLTWVENWYDFHTFELAINSGKINVGAFVAKGLIRFYVDGVEHIGRIEGIKRVLKARGDETHTISGRGIEMILAERLCDKDTATGDGYNALGDTVIAGITFTFAASTTVTASANCKAQVSVGYHLYNSTNDAATSAVKVSAISSDGLTLTLESAYGGTAGSGKAGSVIGLPGETALRTCVYDECIAPSNSSRIVPGLSLVTDSKRGAVVARTLRFDRLSDVMFGICKETGLSFRFTHTTAGMHFTLTVLQGTDVSSTVVLSTDRGNVREIEYFENLLEYKNAVKVLGSGDAASRTTRWVWSGTTEPAGWDRFETSYDASDCITDAALDSKGTSILAELADTTTLDVEYLQTPNPSHILGTHFKLGDIITVDYVTAGIAVVSRITSIESSWAREGKTIKLTIGKKRPDFIDIYKYDKRAASAQKRR